MSKLQDILALSAYTLALAGDSYPYNPPAPPRRTYGAVPNPDTRQLREFSIHGQKIIAYSRKDAIKRLKHQKKSTK